MKCIFLSDPTEHTYFNLFLLYISFPAPQKSGHCPDSSVWGMHTVLHTAAVIRSSWFDQCTWNHKRSKLLFAGVSLSSLADSNRLYLKCTLLVISRSFIHTKCHHCCLSTLTSKTYLGNQVHQYSLFIDFTAFHIIFVRCVIYSWSQKILPSISVTVKMMLSDSRRPADFGILKAGSSWSVKN